MPEVIGGGGAEGGEARFRPPLTCGQWGLRVRPGTVSGRGGAAGGVAARGRPSPWAPSLGRHVEHY